MESTPKVSVVMSVYKETVEWLRQSINSILQQTFKDFEFIIICDNPSYGEGIAFLKNYAKKDSRIILLFNENNIGLTKSLNRGLKFAKGEYIARMDADDISLADRFMRQVNYLDGNPDVLVCGSSIKLIDENGVEGALIKKSDDYHRLRSQILFTSPVAHPVAMFRRMVKNRPVLYDETFQFAQDYALFAALIKDNKIVNLPDVLLNYRISSSQISNKRLKDQNNCARRIIDDIFSNFGILCDSNVKEMLLVLTKSPDEVLHYESVVESVIKLLDECKGNNYLEEQYVREPLMFLACRYLRKHCGLMLFIWCWYVMSKKSNHFNLKLPILLLTKK